MKECESVKKDYKASVRACKLRAPQKTYRCFTNRIPGNFGRN